MERATEEIDRLLLNDWQRDFPLEPRPFAAIGQALDIPESEVLERIKALRRRGMITRVGATCAPNVISASTLAAVAVPDARIEDVAEIINAQAGVNHSYLRENNWNIWFVATGPDRAHVDATLARIGAQTGLRVLDLRLVRPFNIDLGFALDGAPDGTHKPAPSGLIDTSAILPGDRRIIQALSGGLKLTGQPFAALAEDLEQDEAAIIARIRALLDMGLLTRIGVIVRHRALGWRSNAMVVWDLPHDAITDVGPRLAALPGVTLCYERTPVADVWPWRLYNMIHARSHPEALAILERATALDGLRGVPHEVLFSTRCFKQTGALIKSMQEATQ